MACATLIHPHPGGKRRIDAVDGVEVTGTPSKCSRAHQTLDFGLSSASFGSPPRLGRASPPFRDAGRLSPKHFAKPSGTSSPFSSSAVTSSTSSVKLFDHPTQPRPHTSSDTSLDTVRQLGRHSGRQTSSDGETRVTVQQVVEICKQELRQLETRLRQEYEEALQEKQAEQYRAFVQFAQDELQTNMQGPPPDAEMSYIG